MKIATWNVNSLNVRLPHVIEWLSKNNPDVLCLQETKQDNDKFPYSELKSLGWYSYHNGQKTYNGVAIISKKPLTDILLNSVMILTVEYVKLIENSLIFYQIEQLD